MEIIIKESQYRLLMENDLESLMARLKSDSDSFYQKNKDLIDRHQYLTSKRDEHEYRVDPKFTLSVINKTTNPQIVAKVKWPYPYKGKVSKTGYLTIYVGGPKDFPEMLDTPDIHDISKNIISNKLQKHDPFDFK